MAKVANASILEKLLSQVFDLILFDVDKIVDDTSLEKFLEILDCVYNNRERNESIKSTILNFFSRLLEVKCCPTSVSFAIRLTGIICSSSDGLNELFGVENLLEYLFLEIPEKQEFWIDAGLRDSYFKATIRILGNIDSIPWIQNSGVLQHAMNCLVDSSIFVGDSARKFISKYLILLYSSSVDNQHHNDSGFLQDATKHSCRIVKTNTFSAELTTCYNCIVNYLKHIVEKPPTGLARTGSHKIPVTQLLLSLMEEDARASQAILYPSTILLSCFKMLNYINKDGCRKVVDVFFTMLSKTSTWQINWATLFNLQVMENVFNILLEFIVILYKRTFVFLAFQLIYGMFLAGEYINFNESDFCILFMLLTYPVWAKMHKLEEPDKVGCQSVNDIAMKLIAADCSTRDGCELVLGIFKEEFENCLSNSSVLQSLIVATDVMSHIELFNFTKLARIVQMWCKNIVDLLHEQSNPGSNLTKVLIKAVTVCLERGFFYDDIAADGKKCYDLFLKLISSSQESKVISSCFEGLKCLFFNKKTALPSYVKIQRFNELLILHCSNPCWDIRDTTLIFLRHILTTCNAGSIGGLFDRELMLRLWQMMEDDESYVRASSVYLLGALSTVDGVWRDFCKTISFSEEEVLNYILKAFEQDEAAFPRRATMDILRFWLEKKHNIIMAHFKTMSFNFTPLIKVLNSACQDFDWEVKIRGLDCWEALAMVDHCWDNKTSENSFTDAISKVLFDAITDCDQPVRMKAHSIVEILKTSLASQAEVVDNQLHYNGSLDEFPNFVLKTQKDRSCSLLRTLLVIDYSELTASFEKINILQNPLPFLEDILAAASENQDNLLDCY